MFGRLSGGLADYITDHAIKICIFASLLSGVSVALMPDVILGAAQDLPYFYICCSVHGFFTGPLNSLYASCASLLLDTSEYQAYSGAIGMELLLYGVMTIIGKISDSIICHLKSLNPIYINFQGQHLVVI